MSEFNKETLWDLYQLMILSFMLTIFSHFILYVGYWPNNAWWLKVNRDVFAVLSVIAILLNISIRKANEG